MLLKNERGGKTYPKKRVKRRLEEREESEDGAHFEWAGCEKGG